MFLFLFFFFFSEKPASVLWKLFVLIFFFCLKKKDHSRRGHRDSHRICEAWESSFWRRMGCELMRNFWWRFFLSHRTHASKIQTRVSIETRRSVAVFFYVANEVAYVFQSNFFFFLSSLSLLPFPVANFHMNFLCYSFFIFFLSISLQGDEALSASLEDLTISGRQSAVGDFNIKFQTNVSCFENILSLSFFSLSTHMFQASAPTRYWNTKTAMSRLGEKVVKKLQMSPSFVRWSRTPDRCMCVYVCVCVLFHCWN